MNALERWGTMRTVKVEADEVGFAVAMVDGDAVPLFVVDASGRAFERLHVDAVPEALRAFTDNDVPIRIVRHGAQLYAHYGP